MSTNAHRPTHTFPPLTISPVVIRAAADADRPALARLAQRDSSSVPTGTLLVAERDGELRAAVEVASGRAIADPFEPTAELVSLLRARAAQVRGSERRPLRLIARTPAHPRPALVRRAA
jgi:hypothetical protein